MINKYLIIKELGRGSHGKVKLARDTENGMEVAIKIVEKTTRHRRLGFGTTNLRHRHLGKMNSQIHQQYLDPQLEKIKREIAILKKLAHPNVVRLYEVIDDPMSEKVYMVMEYIDGGEIPWKDDSGHPLLTIDEARKIIRDVIVGLEYLHYQGIIHRDIKPANLLWTKSKIVKISDFGVSHFSQKLADRSHEDDDLELAKTAGSPAFFAPELCLADDIDNSSKRPPITKAIDVWAVGVTLFCLIFGRCPFMADTEFELFDVIPKQPLEFPAESPIPDSLKDLLSLLLEKDPVERITLEEVKVSHR
ncbi:kinase-like domain-containing protein [Paraphysoderma sedebokerense]|nr:kinase-like domain-containing protein [Paraphysoderma sedebokerense]